MCLLYLIKNFQPTLKVILEPKPEIHRGLSSNCFTEGGIRKEPIRVIVFQLYLVYYLLRVANVEQIHGNPERLI